MRIVMIADLHGLYNQLRIPDGDLLIVAGDLTDTGKAAQVAAATAWVASLPHKYKVVVAGNHDWYFEREPKYARSLLEERGIMYLQDSGINIQGLYLYGSPWQPAFCNWAFNVPRGKLGRYWEQIPQGLDILITHGPPYGILDQAIPAGTRRNAPWEDPEPFSGSDHAGCEELLAAVQRTRPRIHVFGHLHGSYGTAKNEHTKFYNASLANEQYKLVNPPWVIGCSPHRQTPSAERRD